jgi:hypothetical protein
MRTRRARGLGAAVLAGVLVAAMAVVARIEATPPLAPELDPANPMHPKLPASPRSAEGTADPER